MAHQFFAIVLGEIDNAGPISFTTTYRNRPDVGHDPANGPVEPTARCCQ
jgi:hypothetical protein